MNSLAGLDGVIWLVASLIGLVLLQRALHREIQAFFLILTKRPQVTQVIFALIFLPGVILHELSHFVMAKLLGVKTGRVSLVPQAQSNGRLRLGYVETFSGGFLRDALIGLAPLVAGSFFVAVMATNQLNMLPLWDHFIAADWRIFWNTVLEIPLEPDFWLWFYLAFTISSTMMPSASDRQAWLPVGLLVILLLIVAILAGAGQWMVTNLAPPVNEFFQSLALIFGFSSLIHLILLFPFFLLHKVIARLRKIDVG